MMRDNDYVCGNGGYLRVCPEFTGENWGNLWKTYHDTGFCELGTSLYRRHYWCASLFGISKRVLLVVMNCHLLTQWDQGMLELDNYEV